MAILDDIIAAKAEEYNALREVYFPPESVLMLQKPSETENEFETLDYLSSDWYLKYSEYRQQFRLMIARNDWNFTETIKQATHVSINDEVYIVKSADTIPPQGTEPVWQLFCERFFNKGQFSNLY